MTLSRAEKKARKELVDATRVALQNESTRYLVRWLLQRSGVLSVGVDEGRRSLGVEVIAVLNEVDPYEFVRIMKEGADEVVLKRNRDRKTPDVHT